MRKLLELEPASADVLADYADALAMAQGRSIAGKPLELVKRALKIDPNHWKALAMAGTAAFDSKDYRGRRRLLGEDARERAAPIRTSAKSIDSSIAEARQLAGMGPVASAGAAPRRLAAAGPGPRRWHREDQRGALGEGEPDDTVFIFARPAEGREMPLAIVRQSGEGPSGHLRARRQHGDVAGDEALRVQRRGRRRAYLRSRAPAMPQSGDLEASPRR